MNNATMVIPFVKVLTAIRASTPDARVRRRDARRRARERDTAREEEKGRRAETQEGGGGVGGGKPEDVHHRRADARRRSAADTWRALHALPRALSSPESLLKIFVDAREREAAGYGGGVHRKKKRKSTRKNRGKGVALSPFLSLSRAHSALF